MSYPFQKIEKKWQKNWEELKIFRASDRSKKPKFYCLDMFPYPSAYGLHVGHLKGYTISDLIAKQKLMQGYNVLHPMGWDAFGLPAENFAIKTGIHPRITTKKSINRIKKQMISSGLGYDWSREINTSTPDYYKWTQWMFLQLYKAGLAYREKSAVNYCPKCKTVLAREQVINGRCERCGSLVKQKDLEQWFFKITKYAERLLKDLEKIDWPENIKLMQRNWIGKSSGVTVRFQIVNSKLSVDVFTTRADTLFGCTYIVLAPEHPIIETLKPRISNFNSVKRYIRQAKQKTEIERTSQDKSKTGIELKGILAINPVNQKQVPVYVADYVLGEYGTGAIMAVPAHDQRDFDFARKHNLKIIEVIRPKSGKSNFPDEAYVEDGILINSGKFSGLTSKQARAKIAQYLQKNNLGKKEVYYKLRDWLISRQRYWGAPIPMIHCSKCGWVPVPESELPVILPRIKDFKPAGGGKSPLAKSEKFVKVKCPKCGGKAFRETDTMDTFVCSSWYFLRYIDSKNSKQFASKSKIKKWLPVDLYIGGAEHAVMHLLYARFLTKFLFDKKLIDFDEPFSKLFNQGTVYRHGAKMSKSKGNVVVPDELIKKYGADTLRLYELFMGPAEQATEWSDRSVVGCYRFLNRIWKLQSKIKELKPESSQIQKLLHQSIKMVTEHIKDFRFNTAVSTLMVLVNEIEKQPYISKSTYESLIKLIAPFTPHIAEELWQRLGNKKSIFTQSWPKYNPELIKAEKITLIIQVNGKLRDKLEVIGGLSESEVKEIALNSEKIKRYIQGKKIKKIIYIPDKLINLVI